MHNTVVEEKRSNTSMHSKDVLFWPCRDSCETLQMFVHQDLLFEASGSTNCFSPGTALERVARKETKAVLRVLWLIG